MKLASPVWGWGEGRGFAQARDHSALDGVHGFPTATTFPLVTRGIVYGQARIGRVAEALDSRSPFAVVTGLKTRTRLHYGTKSVLDQVRWYWEQGAEVFIALSDIWAWASHREPVFEASKTAIEGYVLDCLTVLLGESTARREDLERIHIYSQWARKEIAYFAIALQSFLEEDELTGQGGLEERLFPLVVGADIIHVQLKKFGGVRPVLVPVGVDQTTYLSGALPVLETYRTKIRPDFHPVSCTYHRMLSGLDGDEMSAENPDSALFLSESESETRGKLAKLLGGELLSPGTPVNCVVFDLHRFIADDDEEVIRRYEDCSGGSLTCTDCVKETGSLVARAGARFTERREEMRQDEGLVEFLLKQDLLRTTEAVTEITTKATKT